MAYPQSPGVFVNEIDLSTIVSGVSTSEGAIAGVFRWGPLETRMLVDSETKYVNFVGKPTSFNQETFFTGASFLAYANTLYVVRAANTSGTSPIVNVTANGSFSGINSGNSTIVITANSTTNTSVLQVGMILMDTSNASLLRTGTKITQIINSSAFKISTNNDVISTLGQAEGSATLQFVANTTAYTAVVNTAQISTHSYNIIKNENDFINKNGTFDQDVIFAARCPGELGNSLKISVCDSANTFSSNVALGNSTVVGVLSIADGANSGTVVWTGGSVSDANTFANTFINDISLTDYLVVGNNSIGTQYLKLTGKPSVPSINSTNAFVTLNFEEPLRLIANVSQSSSDLDTIQRYWEHFETFQAAPGQSTYQLNFGNSACQDELHIVVIDQDGKFTGVPGTILERYAAVSRATDSKTDENASNFYRDVINDASQYIWSTNDIDGFNSTDALNLADSTAGLFSHDFNYGYDGSDENSISISALVNAYDFFASKEDVEISLIMQGKARGGSAGGQLANYILDNICSKRQDCVVFISPSKEDVVNNVGFEADAIVEFRNTLRSSSYGFLDSGYKYMYDRYNDRYLYIPLNGDIAGLAARTDSVADPWFSFAGFNRGNILNIVRLAYNPRQTDRDILYKSGINPVVTFPGEGTILYGDKTLQVKSSAFDRINVRRLFIVLEKAISRASKYTLFELNDAFTRATFKNLIVPFLRDVKGRRGITDFAVVCDDSNNTPEVIDRNEFIGDIYIKPARSINFIKLNFIAVRSGIAFSEVINQF